MKDEELREIIPEILVIGAGIAGMQAALDIGDKGFKVHLVEKDTCVGAIWPNWIKPFPPLIALLVSARLKWLIQRIILTSTFSPTQRSFGLKEKLDISRSPSGGSPVLLM